MILHEVARSRLDKGQCTYIAYVDFSKAFDRIRRPLLLHKLQLLGVPSLFCRSLDFIFRSTQFFIKSGDFYCNHFSSNVGVPQGDPISPILFNLFISDLPTSLLNHGAKLHGVRVPYIQYADDLCIIGESAEDLQLGLDCLSQYCKENYIEVNVTKTKVQVFHRGRLPACTFELDGRTLELVNDFTYLGFGFSTQLSFSKHVNTINTKARAKCGLLFARLPILELPLSIVLKLFSIFILPIYHYGLPLWLSNCSSSSIQAVNATYTKFLKRYLLLPSHSNNASVHFLTSTTPLSMNLKRAAPNIIGSLSFPSILHGHQLSFFPQPEEGNQSISVIDIVKDIPTPFWLSRMPWTIPYNSKQRKKLLREIFDSDHYKICKTTTFHPNPTQSCVCIHCGESAHTYHFFLSIHQTLAYIMPYGNVEGEVV